MKAYRYLIFDADDTLLDFKQNEAKALPAVFQQYHLPFTKEIRDSYLQINQRLWRLLEQGKKTTNEVMVQRFELLFEMYHIDIHPHLFSESYMQLLSKGAYPFDEVLAVLKQCSQDYICVIVTNGFAKSQRYRLAHSGILPYIHHVFISEEVGVRKPSIQLANHIFHQLQCKPSECLMIGDCFETDMEFAINVGMDTCWIRHRNDFDERISQVNYHITNLNQLFAGGILK